MNILSFPHIKALGIKFDFVIKWVMVNLDISFVQTW